MRREPEALDFVESDYQTQAHEEGKISHDAEGTAARLQ